MSPRSRSHSLMLALALLLGLIVWGASRGWSGLAEPKAETVRELTPPDTSLQKLQRAACRGKYRMLLRQFEKVDEPNAPSGFREMGLLKVSQYAGQTGLPMGYWVYCKPYWFIWRDLTVLSAPRQAWGPQEATGPPDTPAVGDFGTAWAALTPGTQPEWLLLEYPKAVIPTAVHVHESWNPGAVVRVSLFQPDGKEVVAWEGNDPTPPDRKHGVSNIPVKCNFPTNRVKIDLTVLPGKNWHEIDAVGLADQAGTVHWAHAAEASSTAAGASERLLALALAKTHLRISQLEQELAELRRLVNQRDGDKAK